MSRTHWDDAQFIHNELVPAVPFGLVIKIAYQAAKGMHFLHSSGIVHRDLKSLNLLLDSKWNVKVRDVLRSPAHAHAQPHDTQSLKCTEQVSDFGLTKFNEELKQNAKGGEVQGSIHWTAPGTTPTPFHSSCPMDHWTGISRSGRSVDTQKY
jgi:serine/threonine protein kinase